MCRQRCNQLFVVQLVIGGSQVNWSARDFNIPPHGIAGLHKIIQKPVDHLFVEYSFVSESLQVQFQRFQFDAPIRRSIRERDRAEVGLPCFGANAREFRTNNIDDVIPPWSRIGKRLELIEMRNWFSHRLPQRSSIFRIVEKTSLQSFVGTNLKNRLDGTLCEHIC